MKRFALIGLLVMPVLATGCSQLQPTPVQASTPTPQPEAKHNYRLYGSPDKGEFMVDTDTAAVWQYEETPDHVKAFVAVPVVQKPEEAKNPVSDPLGILK